jgi:hypothetical protein
MSYSIRGLIVEGEAHKLGPFYGGLTSHIDVIVYKNIEMKQLQTWGKTSSYVLGFGF